ncbi:MAG: hypothetical protein AVDCRST_MAG95-721 [uncultured Adhaeribacter sp.]|uniref:Uncharacterized protein n=1 Tax=uncultured Adhaeribacter sp. TaxID=448109 RepID=A0A6J4HIV4_9BACT|nr:MAG: hypothetical protein AVDCRST_MAG95-721 [uncultured Adhaeribacter sp.]
MDLDFLQTAAQLADKRSAVPVIRYIFNQSIPFSRPKKTDNRNGITKYKIYTHTNKLK